MAKLWSFQCEFDVIHVNECDDSLIPEGAEFGSTEGLFIRYGVTSFFNNYNNDPSGEGLRFHGLSVEYSSVLHQIRDLEELHGSPNALSRRIFNNIRIPLGIWIEIRDEVERKTISWMNDYNYNNNADHKVLLYHVKISTSASRYINDDQEQDHGQDDGIVYVIDEDDMEADDLEDDDDVEDDDDDDMARVVTNSMEDDNPGTCIPAAPFSIESLPKATYESDKFEMKTCRVCLNEFEEGQEVILMPCEHIYHGDCIVKWLLLSNLCPLCRFSMPVGY